MLTRKFFLTIDQREILVEALLRQATAIESDIKKSEKIAPQVIECAESGIQTRRHLADLFKVGEYEK